MTTIFFNGYHATEGTTEVHKFWGDIHDLSFRADKVIRNRADLEDVATRFEADRSQFDWTSYASHSEFNKASRTYFSLIEGRKDFMEITFEYAGKIYRTRTTKWSKKRDIEKKADKVLKLIDVQTISLMRDDNGEVISIVKELGKVNHYLDDLSDARDSNSYMEF